MEVDTERFVGIIKNGLTSKMDTLASKIDEELDRHQKLIETLQEHTRILELARNRMLGSYAVIAVMMGIIAALVMAVINQLLDKLIP